MGRLKWKIPHRIDAVLADDFLQTGHHHSIGRRTGRGGGVAQQNGGGTLKELGVEAWRRGAVDEEAVEGVAGAAPLAQSTLRSNRS